MFSFDVKPFRKKDGGLVNVILVTGDNTDSTRPYKDEMKNFGAKWISGANTWGWFASDDKTKLQSQINSMVKPAIEFLMDKEQDKGGDESRTVVSVLDKLMQLLSTENTEEEIAASNNIHMSQKEIKDKIYEFKAQLVNAVSSDEFKRLLEPIIKARKAQGYKYSFMNTILIWCQDPQATMVKSKKAWSKMNREVVANAPAIWLWMPYGGQKMFKTKQEREAAKERWMQQHNIADESEMTPGDKDLLQHYLDRTEGETTFKLGPYFFDVRYTKQMEGKEDLVGDPNAQVDWYNDKGNETTAVKEKIEALLNVVKDSGVNVSTTKNLGGALGVSKGGSIEVLDKAKQNSNYLMTVCHEFAHELLHQQYLKSKNTEWGQFYAGRAEGRGFVEQQAELTAWIVCNFYGYNIKEAINYAGCWGMEEKNAVHAFDTVAKVADFIINKMNEKIKAARSNNVVENKETMINEVNFTGADIARMVGAEDVYQRSAEMNQQAEAMQTEAKNNFFDMFNRMNEAEKNNRIDKID